MKAARCSARRMGAKTLAGAVAMAVGLGGGCYRHRTEPIDRAPRAVQLDFVDIPPGRFIRGDINGEPSEYPERTVTVRGFRLARFEVSNRAYRVCVEAQACDVTPYLDDPMLGRPDYPVVGVSWEDASRFCAWAGGRLATEAEWEYAAKGPGQRRYPWDGPFDPQRANTSQPDDPYPQTAPTEDMAAGDSTFGIRNMAGNAAEWVNDYFDPMYYRASQSAADPSGPTSGRERVVRGGSYRDSPYLVRVAARRPQEPTDVDNTVGIRCAGPLFDRLQPLP